MAAPSFSSVVKGYLMTCILVALIGSSTAMATMKTVHDGNLATDVGNTTLRVRFLVTVNDTWDPNGCMTTVSTPFVSAGAKKHNPKVTVGDCDHGAFEFLATPGNDDGVSKTSVVVTFHSSVINDASPPSCAIAWNGTYLAPLPDWYKMD